MYAILIILCLLGTLTFAARLVCAPFCSKIVAQMRKHPLIHWVWGCVAFAGALVLFATLNPMWWPPPFIERQQQREKVLERVKSAGGWTAIQQACDTLVKQSREGGFFWHRGETNALPPALAALKPLEVWSYPTRSSQDGEGGSQVAIVRIRIFGMHSSGGHSTPCYSLEVPCGRGAEGYNPRLNQKDPGARHRKFRKVADGVFEIY